MLYHPTLYWFDFYLKILSQPHFPQQIIYKCGATNNLELNLILYTPSIHQTLFSSTNQISTDLS